MAQGIRIRPRDGLTINPDGMIVVVDHARPFPPPADGTPLVDVQPLCPICRVQHFAKTYHIQLRAGSAIVSQEIWQQFEMLRTPSGEPDNPFVFENTVAEPPAQLIDPWSTRPPEILEKFVMPITTRSD